jgi:hypothetical protein
VKPAGQADPAEVLAAEIVAAFAVTGLKPTSGDWFDYDFRRSTDNAGCVTAACGVGILRHVSEDDAADIVPSEHVDCVVTGWDSTVDGDDRPITVHCCNGGYYDCPYFQAGVLAAHAMETP